MLVFIGMECSGTIRRAFEAQGHEAWSCDLKPAEDGSARHIQGDVFEVLRSFGRTPDLGIFHPVCTLLSSSGFHWCYKDPAKYPNTLCGPARLAAVESAVADFMKCVNLDLPRIAIENPIGIMSTRYREPDQILQPNDFGEDASKATCLWLMNVAPLFPTRIEFGRVVNGRRRWANQTDSGQNKLPPSSERPADRARTYPGIADAMARQWGSLRRCA